MRFGSPLSWTLAGVGLVVGGAEFVLDQWELPEGGLYRAVELFEMVLMVPGLAVGLFFFGEWIRARDRALASQLANSREERFALLGRLAAAVAHEVRNPLHGLRLVHEAMAEDDQVDPALLVRMHRNIDHIGAAVERIYELVQPVLSDTTLAESLSCRELVTEVVETDLGDCAAAIAIATSSEGQQVRVVRSGLRIVLANVLRNACQAVPNPAPGSVSVAIGSDDDGVVIEIRNPGTLPPAVCARYAQRGDAGPAREVASDKEDGLGLGLMISEQILIRSGGSLHMQQLDPHTVATLVRLPRVEEEGAS